MADPPTSTTKALVGTPESLTAPHGLAEASETPKRVRRNNPVPPIRCPQCWETRTARDACHCGGADGCHLTFSGVGPFDLHRSQYGERGACLHPGTVLAKDGTPKLEFRNGMWRGYLAED